MTRAGPYPGGVVGERETQLGVNISTQYLQTQAEKFSEKESDEDEVLELVDASRYQLLLMEINS